MTPAAGNISMSGHSKWKNIMHKKEKTDAQRAKVFTKIGKEITIAVKSGGADPVSNPRLRDLIAKAKSNNVPNDNIERVIKKAAGGGDGVIYEEITYEGYGPSGIAVIVEATTDTRNRTASEVRHYFDKFGGNLGQSGCVSYLFETKGVIVIERGELDEDKLMEEELEAGAADFVADEDVFEIYTEPDDLGAVREALEEMAVRWAVARITEDEIKEMEEQCDLMEFYTRKKDKKKVMEMNTSFHEVIYASAKSRFLAQVLRSYKDYIDKTRKSIFYEQAYLEAILKEHRAILEGIREKNQEKAVAAMARHLECSQARAEAVWNLK